MLPTKFLLKVTMM